MKTICGECGEPLEDHICPQNLLKTDPYSQLGEVEDIVEIFMDRHNISCEAGFEIPDQDRLVIKSLLIDFYSRIKDNDLA